MTQLTATKTLFPRLSAYLNSLPKNLDSYPDVKTRAFYSIALWKKLEAGSDIQKIPEALRRRCKENWQPGDWIPTTLYAALCALTRDCLWTTDEAFHTGMADIAAEMYKSALYRTLMLLLSPSLMVMGSTKRWGSFHQGTELLLIKQSKCDADLTLTFPPFLFGDAALRSLGATFCAAVAGARGKNPEVSVKTLASNKAQYLLKWHF